MSMGINDFKIINEEVTGVVRITVDTQFNKINADVVTVSANVNARLFGDIKEKLVLKKGSKVFLHGVVFGNVENEGGELHVFAKK